jgi:hypothetical protein
MLNISFYISLIQTIIVYAVLGPTFSQYLLDSVPPYSLNLQVLLILSVYNVVICRIDAQYILLHFININHCCVGSPWPTFQSVFAWHHATTLTKSLISADFTSLYSENWTIDGQHMPLQCIHTIHGCLGIPLVRFCSSLTLMVSQMYQELELGWVIT